MMTDRYLNNMANNPKKIFPGTQTQTDIQFSAISWTGASATNGIRNFLASLYTHFNGVSSYWSIKSGTASTTSATGDGGFIIKNSAGVEICFANGYDVGSTMKTNKCPNVFGDTVGTYGSSGTYSQNDVHLAIAPAGGVSSITDRATQIATATRFSGWTRASGGDYGGLYGASSSYAYAKIVETPNYVFLRKHFVSGDNKYYNIGFFAGQMETHGNNATGFFIACAKFDKWLNSGGTMYNIYHMRYEASNNIWIPCAATPDVDDAGFESHATYTRNQHPGNDQAGSPTYNFYKVAIFDIQYDGTSPDDWTFVGYVPCLLAGQEGNCNPNEDGGLTSLNYNGSTFAHCFGSNDQACWYVRDDGSVTENP